MWTTLRFNKKSQIQAWKGEAEARRNKVMPTVSSGEGACFYQC